jgi:Pvc16 N-terminal domain
LKNGPHSRLRDGRIIYENRPVHLYLYLLFSANNPVYSTALTQLSRVIEFFQGQNVFTIRNSPDLAGVSLSADALAGLRIVLELQSLTFEQVNYLWGSLGGKQVPFVLYRARLIALTAGDIASSGPPIEEIEVDDYSATPP